MKSYLKQIPSKFAFIIVMTKQSLSVTEYVQKCPRNRKIWGAKWGKFKTETQKYLKVDLSEVFGDPVREIGAVSGRVNSPLSVKPSATIRPWLQLKRSMNSAIHLINRYPMDKFPAKMTLVHARTSSFQNVKVSNDLSGSQRSPP